MPLSAELLLFGGRGRRRSSGARAPARLRSVTLGGWLAVLTAAGTGDDGEGEPLALDEASLAEAFRDPETGLRDVAAEVEACEAVLAEALVDPPSRFESEEALRATAAAAFDAYATEAARQSARAERRIRQIERLVGHSAGAEQRVALERSLAGLSGEEYVALSRLPLWEALLIMGSRSLERDLQRENRELLS